MKDRFGRYELVDTLTTIGLADPSSIKESHKAFAIIELTPGMNKGQVNWFLPGRSMEHNKSFIEENTGLSVTQEANVEIVTAMHLDKCVEIISTAVKELGKHENKAGSKAGSEKGGCLSSAMPMPNLPEVG